MLGDSQKLNRRYNSRSKLNHSKYKQRNDDPFSGIKTQQSEISTSNSKLFRLPKCPVKRDNFTRDTLMKYSHINAPSKDLFSSVQNHTVGGSRIYEKSLRDSSF